MLSTKNAAHAAANGGARPDRSLPDHGIHLRSHRPGEHRTACPECAASKHRPGDQALAVRIAADGSAVWTCHRCSWKGATGSERGLGCRPGHRRRPPPPQAPPDPAPDLEAEHRRERAQEIWRQTEAIADGPPLDYLSQRRGVAVWDCDRVRWHPRCPWQGGTAGCIVCPVTDHGTGYTTAIWRIRPIMDGPVERRGLGPVKHNAARLFDAPGPELVIAEGIEDALAAHTLFGGVPAWASLSAGNLAALILPPRIQQVLILADRDKPKEDGRQVGLEAAYELARRLRREGRSAEVRWSRIGKDANDVLRGTAA
jgi:putative DNA primase/helicase